MENREKSARGTSVHDYSGRERSGEKTRRTENATRRQAAARSARTSLNQLHRSFLSFFLSFLVGTCVPRCPANQAGQPFAGSLVANVNSDEISLAIPLRSDDDLSILLEFAIHSFHRYQYHEQNIQNWKFSSDSSCETFPHHFPKHESNN